MNRLYPEIRWVKDIKPLHIEVFLTLRSPQWTKKTNICYQDFFRKLELIINRVYHLDFDFSEIDFIKTSKPKVRDRAISVDDFIKLTNAFFFTSSKCRLAPLLTVTLGTRSEELVSIKPEEIDINKRIVHLTNCKNGRNRDVPIDPRFLFLWKFVKEYSENRGWTTIFDGLKLHTYISRFSKTKNKLDLSYDYKEGNHGLRKLYAIRRFTEEQLKGYDTPTSWSHVQVELGHGSENREDLFKVYIGQDYKEYLKESEFSPKYLMDKKTYNKLIEFIKSFEIVLDGFKF